VEAKSKAEAKRIVLHPTLAEDAERLIDEYNYHSGCPQLDVDGAFVTKEDALLSVAPAVVDRAKARRAPKKTRGVKAATVNGGGR
jgi:hypothetical protein